MELGVYRPIDIADGVGVTTLVDTQIAAVEEAMEPIPALVYHSHAVPVYGLGPKTGWL